MFKERMEYVLISAITHNDPKVRTYIRRLILKVLGFILAVESLAFGLFFLAEGWRTDTVLYTQYGEISLVAGIIIFIIISYIPIKYEELK